MTSSLQLSRVEEEWSVRLAAALKEQEDELWQKVQQAGEDAASVTNHLEEKEKRSQEYLAEKEHDHLQQLNDLKSKVEMAEEEIRALCQRIEENEEEWQSKVVEAEEGHAHQLLLMKTELEERARSTMVAMEKRYQERLMKLSIKHEEELRAITDRQRREIEVESCRSKMAHFRSFKVGEVMVADFEEVVGSPFSDYGPMSDKALISSLRGKRHKLLAMRLRRHQVEKGLLRLGALCERQHHHRVRRGFRLWIRAIGLQLVDVRRWKASLFGQ